jgi:glycosyltransferase involved in cell wall biosynthesis
VDIESFFTNIFFDTANKYSPTIFVANDLPTLPVAAKLANQHNSKLIYDSHELYSEQEFPLREKLRWSKIESKYIKKCDAIITVNNSIAKELESRYDLSDVNVIYNAEKTLNIQIKRQHYFHNKFELPSDKKVLLMQGGLSKGRNLEKLIDSMLNVTNKSIVLVILGNGDLLDTLKAKVVANRLFDRVFFHHAVVQSELLTLTMSADAGVIPYQATCLNNYYCTPNKLFEFIAAGLPILSSDLPEIKRIIETHKIGLVGDMSTSDNIAKLIDSFFSETISLNLWKASVLAARNRICWEEEEKKLLEIYSSI